MSMEVKFNMLCPHCGREITSADSGINMCGECIHWEYKYWFNRIEYGLCKCREIRDLAYGNLTTCTKFATQDLPYPPILRAGHTKRCNCCGKDEHYRAFKKYVDWCRECHKVNGKSYDTFQKEVIKKEGALTDPALVVKEETKDESI